MRRLWLRVVARATPQVTCKAHTPLTVTAGAGASSSSSSKGGSGGGTQGWFGLGGGGGSGVSARSGKGGQHEDPLTHFMVMARVSNDGPILGQDLGLERERDNERMETAFSEVRFSYVWINATR